MTLNDGPTPRTTGRANPRAAYTGRRVCGRVAAVVGRGVTARPPQVPLPVGSFDG